jgi:hypothetical protein
MPDEPKPLSTPCPCEKERGDEWRARREAESRLVAVAAACSSLRDELARAIEGQGILGTEIANLRADLAASQERERVLREALEPFAGMAERFFALAEGKPVVEDEDRVTCEYVWLEFRHVLKVRDLRRAARALTPDRPYTSPSPERPSTADEGLSISGHSESVKCQSQE